MKSPIIAIMMFAVTASAQPWIDHTGKVAWRLPAQFHAPDKTVMINPTLNQLRHYGWAEAEQITVTEVITNTIDPELQLTIVQYQRIIEGLFGPGAHTNDSVSEDAVVRLLRTSTNVPLSTITALKVVRDELRTFHPGHFSTLPYGQAELVMTNVLTRWEAVE